MSQSIQPAGEVKRRELRRVRAWLRGVMPRVALGAGVLLFVWLMVHEISFYRKHDIFILFGLLTSFAVCLTIIYYGFKSLRWVKRRLLWRVRRRLVITYLFIGLTPIILLSVLGLLSAFGGSSQALARIVTAQLSTTERQSLADAHELSDEFARLPQNMDERSVQAWLDERVALVRATLPGARVAIWRGAASENASTLGSSNSAQFVADIADENARGVGGETLPLNAPLPEWLNGRVEWSGLAYTMPADTEQPFGAPSIRAVVRGKSANKDFVLLLVVPVSRALVQQYRDNTGIYVRPYFATSTVVQPGGGIKITFDDEEAGQRKQKAKQSEETKVDEQMTEERVREMFFKDQLGEPLKGQPYIVVQPATRWLSGETTPKLAFVFDWSWAIASKQLLGGSDTGEAWRVGLKVVGVVFLVFELLALLAAAWMTRAVTGTVHKLYRATEYIKRGDFSHRVRVRSRDQLGELALSFNDMAANVESLLHERVERERLQREVEIAAEVQAQLFPRCLPDLSTVEAAAECRAARGVAGDYYDYVEVAPGLVLFALGDVAGKGISAALVMSNLQAALRAQTTLTSERLSIAERAVAASVDGPGNGRLLAHVVADAGLDGSVSRMATHINRQLCQSTDANRFATLFLALYDEHKRALRYTNAGHNAAILVRADGTVERLTNGGIMTGAFDWATYEETSTALQPGDLLLIFSDGISEAQRVTGEEYGEARLLQFALRHRTLSPHELLQAIFQEVDEWSGSQERGDDQTLVIIKSKV